MIHRVVLGVELGASDDLAMLRRFVSTWNERNEVLYKNGALVTDIGNPVAEGFSNALQTFNRSQGTALTLTRRFDVEYEKADIDRAEWLRLNINGFAGAGSRELARDTYEESKCPGCGYRQGIRQLHPLVVLKGEMRKKDFLNTSHLETLVSDRARDLLQECCGDELNFSPIDTLIRSRVRKRLPGFSQLKYNVVGGHFSSQMKLDLGKKCATCGREESRTTGGAPFVAKRASLPNASVFLLDEGLGSSVGIPSRSMPPIVTKSLFLKLKKQRLTGFYVQPVLLD